MRLHGIAKINFIPKYLIMKKNKIIYSLNEEDIQTVAREELGRELSSKEIKKIIEPIAEKINWFDVIANSIEEEIGDDNSK